MMFLQEKEESLSIANHKLLYKGKKREGLNKSTTKALKTRQETENHKREQSKTIVKNLPLSESV